MADETLDPNETTEETPAQATEATPEALGPTGDASDAAPVSQSETPPESADSSPEAGAPSDGAEPALGDGSEVADAPVDPTSPVLSAVDPSEHSGQESNTSDANTVPPVDSPQESSTTTSGNVSDGDAPVDPTDAQTGPDALPAPDATTEQDGAAAEGDVTQDPTSEADSAPAADGAQTTASAPEALPPEEGGLLPDAPVAKAPEHDEVHSDGSDRVGDAPMGVPAQEKNDRPTDGEPGDGPTHVGTDTPEMLVSNPCDPKTGKPLDGSGQPKGVVVGGSGSLNRAPDLSKTFGLNNDQTMEEASAGLPEGYEDESGDEAETSDDSCDAGGEADGDGDSLADKEALYQAIESKVTTLLEDVAEMLGL